jgi:hypothetical protein
MSSTYTMVPGRLKAFLELYEREGLSAQRRHQGDPVGYFVIEIGTNNQVVHLWGYESLADREQRRAGSRPGRGSLPRQERRRRQCTASRKQDPEIGIVLADVSRRGR